MGHIWRPLKVRHRFAMSARRHDRFVEVHVKFNQCAPSGERHAKERFPAVDLSLLRAILGVRSLNSIIRRIKIRRLKEQLAFRQLKCAALAEKFESADLTTKQKAEITNHRADTLKESHSMQLAIDLLEREEREERSAIDSLVSGD
jgi:hypothetical protein